MNERQKKVGMKFSIGPNHWELDSQPLINMMLLVVPVLCTHVCTKTHTAPGLASQTSEFGWSWRNGWVWIPVGLSCCMLFFSTERCHSKATLSISPAFGGRNSFFQFLTLHPTGWAGLGGSGCWWWDLLIVCLSFPTCEPGIGTQCHSKH